MRKVLLRLPDNVYDALKSDAAERGKSMNASAVELFSTFFELAASTSVQKSDSTIEKVIVDSAGASTKSAITQLEVLADSANASTKSDSTSVNASTKSDSTSANASTSLEQFASMSFVSPAALSQLSESDALSVEYAARAGGRWSNTP